jgi:hypothetical protein
VHLLAKKSAEYSGNNPEMCIIFEPGHYQRFKKTTFRVETPESHLLLGTPQANPKV